MTGRDGAFVTLNYGTVSLRAVATAMVPISAEVREVLWHHLRAEPMYLLRVAGKQKSKRYWNADFTS